MENFSKVLFENNTDISSSPVSGSNFVGIEKKHWVKIDGKQYLYKIDGLNNLGFTELFFSHMGQLLDFDCVNVYPATKGNTKGVIVESFITPDVVQVVTLSELINKYDKKNKKDHNVCIYSVEEFLKIEKKLNKDGVYLSPDLLEKFKKMILVDCVLGNTDRHLNNVEFLVYKDINGKNYITLAPMFDNGRILSRESEFKYKLQGPYVFAHRDTPRLTMHSRQDCYNLAFEIKTDNAIYSIAKEIIRDPELMNLYQRFKRVSIEYELKYVNQKSNYNLSEEEIDFMVKFYKQRIALIDAMLGLIKEDPKIAEKQYTHRPMRFCSVFKFYEKNIEKIEKRMKEMPKPEKMIKLDLEASEEIIIQTQQNIIHKQNVNQIKNQDHNQCDEMELF